MAMHDFEAIRVPCRPGGPDDGEIAGLSVRSVLELQAVAAQDEDTAHLCVGPFQGVGERPAHDRPVDLGENLARPGPDSRRHG